MKRNLFFRFVTFYSIVSLLLQSSLPFLYILPQAISAQDITPTSAAEVSTKEASTGIPEPTLVPTSEPISIPTVAPTAEPTLAPTGIPEPTLTPTITPTSVPSQWTFEKVELNKEYVAPQNGGVKLIFTKLPNPSGNIKIAEITLTAEQIKQTGSLSDKAYDITSDMENGDFSYNLSLPIPESSKGKEVSVKFSEELSTIGSAKEVENTLTSTDTTVSVGKLDHFTIFVVTLSPATECAGGAYASGVCYSTIQQAIDNLATVDGNTISVSAGTYVENVNVTKDLTLQGVTGTNLQGQITISHNGVTIDGFNITNPGGTMGIYVPHYDSIHITHNTFHDIGGADVSGAVQAINVHEGSSNVTIQSNTIYNITSAGYVDSSHKYSAKGIYLGDSSGSSPISTVTIDDNTIYNIISNSAIPNGRWGAYGILVNRQTTGLQITNNNIHDLEGLWAHAIGLEGDTPTAVLSTNTISSLVDHKTPSDA
ncbi:hypothetical protein COY90_03115, partial [Candidatus Roizmanbacteria bacterium CG_4_10_14_0_8_um_filter_39_9]